MQLKLTLTYLYHFISVVALSPFYPMMGNKLSKPNIMCVTSAVIRSSKNEKVIGKINEDDALKIIAMRLLVYTM